MKYKYVVILKKTGQRATDLLSTLLTLFSALSFFYFSTRNGHPDYLAMEVGTLLLIGLFLTLRYRPKSTFNSV